MSEFWAVVDQARADAAADGSTWPGGSRIGAALADRLAQLTPEQIVAFDEVLADPDALADHPMGQAIAAGQVDRFALAGEAITFAAATAHERVTDDADGFWDAVDSRPDETDEKPPAPGPPWSGRFGGPDDVAQIPERLPRLYRLFKGEPPAAG